MEESPLENIREARGFEDRVEASSAKTTTWSSVNARDCRTRMAQVVFEDPIHHISGKISKKFRTTYNYRKQSERKYTSVRGERDLQNKPYTEKELTHRAKFVAVAAATRSRMADPSQAAADMAAFKAQTKYKTLYRYVFRQEWNAYEG